MNDSIFLSAEADAHTAAVSAAATEEVLSVDDARTFSARSPDNSLPGYRLHRLEVLNWGTFDGTVHPLVLDGQTTLLVGQNGAGKSTLVDALLTLLVRPGKTRNYNLAAGANKTERSEKSYVLGAFDRQSQEDTNRGEVRYLRPNSAGTTTYSVLLACFQNHLTDRVFTLAQLLYLSDGGVEKVYCFANDKRSIARDCSGLKGMDKLPQEMKQRGFRATTKYAEYFQWFRKATGVKEQAMDMFNQTVAVKDIQRLNDFIRKHMLEAKPWSDKVDELFKHFKDLSDAHRELERVRQQQELLEPIEKYGAAFRKQAEQLQHAERLLGAADAYFSTKTIESVRAGDRSPTDRPRRNSRRAGLRLKDEICVGQDECRRLKNEIELAGGERMRQIPLLIDKHAAHANAKRAEFGRLERSLRDAEIDEQIFEPVAFEAMRAKLAPLREQLQTNAVDAECQRTALIESRVEPTRLITRNRSRAESAEGAARQPATRICRHATTDVRQFGAERTRSAVRRRDDCGQDRPTRLGKLDRDGFARLCAQFARAPTALSAR